MTHQAGSSKTTKRAKNHHDNHASYGALPATGFVRLADLRFIIPLSDSTIWRRVKGQTFPAPIKLSERVTAWKVEDIRQWLEKQGRNDIWRGPNE